MIVKSFQFDGITPLPTDEFEGAGANGISAKCLTLLLDHRFRHNPHIHKREKRPIGRIQGELNSVVIDDLNALDRLVKSP